MFTNDTITNPARIEFLDEPIWRWFLFFGALIAFGVAWSGIIDFIK